MLMEGAEKAVQAEREDVGKPGFKIGWCTWEPARRPLRWNEESQRRREMYVQSHHVRLNRGQILNIIIC